MENVFYNVVMIDIHVFGTQKLAKPLVPTQEEKFHIVANGTPKTKIYF